jgi:hypothetical protein
MTIVRDLPVRNQASDRAGTTHKERDPKLIEDDKRLGHLYGRSDGSRLFRCPEGATAA